MGAHGGTTLFDKLWKTHVVVDLGSNTALLHVDRHYIHDLGGGAAYKALSKRGLRVHSPALTFATPDHVVSSSPGRTVREFEWAGNLIDALREGSRRFGVHYYDVNQNEQGIVHVMGPELGLTLPGLLVLCGDSHTSTHGALGTLAWGIGASEIVHVLATQTITQKKPSQMRIIFEGKLQPGVEAKDLALAMIHKLGAAGGTGYAVEYAGSTISALGMEGRMTLCNMSVEMGARCGMIAPDEMTYAWLQGRRYAPQGANWDRAMSYWQTLRSDIDAEFDREEWIDVSQIGAQITWGISPEHSIGIDQCVPDPGRVDDPVCANVLTKALDYMGLTAGEPIAGRIVHRVFIGSCTNGRLSDLRAAAVQLRGRRVAAHVRAWVVPGSEQVWRAAESEGLHHLFMDAGFEWRMPACSLCVGANGEFVEPGQRCVSTSNRNFIGRQGPLARTHLASPRLAVECALAGMIVDHFESKNLTWNH